MGRSAIARIEIQSGPSAEQLTRKPTLSNVWAACGWAAGAFSAAPSGNGTGRVARQKVRRRFTKKLRRRKACFT
jgi:hypothetical protein